jgi:hypothetical protein
MLGGVLKLMCTRDELTNIRDGLISARDELTATRDGLISIRDGRDAFVTDCEVFVTDACARHGSSVCLSRVHRRSSRIGANVTTLAEVEGIPARRTWSRFVTNGSIRHNQLEKRANSMPRLHS